MYQPSKLYLALLIVLAAIGGSGTLFASAPMKKADFHDAMRKLWDDHITWTRLFIVSAVADLPDTGATRVRLLKNQSDIGNAVKPFYGDSTGEKLTSLLKEHITTVAEIVSAAKMKENAKQKDATFRLYANADEIAAFLSGANPRNWHSADIKATMYEHLDLTIAEAVPRLKADWAADIAAYEKVHEQILKMADMLSDGIIRQFPKNFR